MNAHPICDDLMTPEVMGDPHTYYRHLYRSILTGLAGCL